MDINQKHAASELHHVGKWRCIWHEGRYTIINPGGLEYELRTDEIEDFHLRSLLSDVFEGLEALQNENAALRERVAMLEGAAGADLADLAAAANAAAANAAKAEREADAAGYKAVIAELRAEVAKLKECAK